MNNEDTRYVYYLADPRDGAIRWVGMTLAYVTKGHALTCY